MKRFILAALSALPAAALAGGSMGGGGLGKEAQTELAMSLLDEARLAKEIQIPDLGLTPIGVSSDVYRRARMRLSTQPQANLSVDGIDVDIKSLSGGIVDINETSQLVIKQ